jgi:predicted enzyme related to lactoylglutathione lyase
MMGNPVLQWQIVSKNPAATARFYTKLFDWRIDSANALGYREVKTGSVDGVAAGIDGGIWPSAPEGHSLIQLFVAVDDVAEYLERATALGAKVIVPVSALPDGDTLAVLLDPQGLSFGIFHRGRVLEP